MPTLNASERLMDLVFEAREEALMMLREGREVTPFVMLFTKEGYVLRRFTAASAGSAVERAMNALRQLGKDTLAYTLVYDGFVTVDNHDHDALLLEAGERDHEHGLRFAQRYRPRTQIQPLRLIGELALLGPAEYYFSTE